MLSKLSRFIKRADVTGNKELVVTFKEDHLFAQSRAAVLQEQKEAASMPSTHRRE
jgi:hypothetical protein